METGIVSGLIEALQAGHWFVVIALATTLLVQLTKLRTDLFDKLQPKHRRWVPIVLAFIASVGVAATNADGDWKRFGWLAVVGGLESGVLAIGMYHAVKPKKPPAGGPDTQRGAL